MTRVSIRRLKDELSACLRRVKKGEQVIVMPGRKKAAAIVPLEEAQELEENARLRQLAAQDLMAFPALPQPTKSFTGHRVPERGKPASEILLKDRR